MSGDSRTRSTIGISQRLLRYQGPLGRGGPVRCSDGASSDPGLASPFSRSVATLLRREACRSPCSHHFRLPSFADASETAFLRSSSEVLRERRRASTAGSEAHREVLDAADEVRTEPRRLAGLLD